MKRTMTVLAVSVAMGLVVPQAAQADNILCKISTNNHMLVDDSIVSGCVDAGVGNIGSGQNDDFLAANSGYTDVTSEAGPISLGSPFSFNASLWDTYDALAIGFKFGTGNQPDEWFVYDLQQGVSTGAWTFVNVFGTGGGLSHITLYATGGTTTVPEPATLGLLTLGVLAFGRRRRQQAVAV
jgi:hypothetical protein